MIDQFRLKKLKMPVRNAAQMSDEEQLQKPEEGIHEQGFLESFENMLNGGAKPEEHGIAKQQISPGSIEKETEGAIERGSSAISGLLGKLPKEKLLQLGEELRLTGKANVVDESGKLVETVGHFSPEGKVLKKLAKDALADSNSRASTIYKGFMGQ